MPSPPVRKKHPKTERALPTGPKVDETRALTAEVQAKIVILIKSGASREVAAPAAGIDARTLRRWCEWGREGRPDYVRFLSAMEQAEAHAEVMHIAVIAKAANAGDWRASAFWLKNARRDRWFETQAAATGIEAEAPQVTLTINRSTGPKRSGSAE